MKKERYVPPSVEVLSVVVERGFQGSESENDGITAPGWGTIK